MKKMKHKRSINIKNAAGIQLAKYHLLVRRRKNIVDVDACMTRLRVTVKDSGTVADKQIGNNRSH